jgi:hypothetical protein
LLKAAIAVNPASEALATSLQGQTAAIACLRKAIEELAAGRPWNALAMVADAQDSALALRDMIKGQTSNGGFGIHDSLPAPGREIPKLMTTINRRALVTGADLVP